MRLGKMWPGNTREVTTVVHGQSAIERWRTNTVDRVAHGVGGRFATGAKSDPMRTSSADLGMLQLFLRAPWYRNQRPRNRGSSGVGENSQPSAYSRAPYTRFPKLRG